MSDPYDFAKRTVRAYDRGEYEAAYMGLRRVVDESPDALRACFSLLYTCERVMQTPPDDGDLPHVARGRLRRAVAALRRAMNYGRPEFVRCKWCGHYTKYVNPDDDLRNSCGRCDAKYPAPSWIYDGPYMMAHSEGRGSWAKDSINSHIWNEMCDRYERESGVKLAS